MLTDLLLALPLGLAGGLAAAWGARGRNGAAAARWALLALLAGLLAASVFSAAFDGYGSDLWVYLASARRVGQGEWLLDREPYWFEPPAMPQHSALWIVAGLAGRFTGIPVHALARALAFGSACFLAWSGAWLYARCRGGPQGKWLALFCLGLALASSWAQIELARSLVLGFVFLSAGLALDFQGGARQVAALAAALAGAFYLHLFGGVLAALAVLISLSARLSQGEKLPWPALSLTAAAAALLAAPPLWFALSTLGYPKAAEHLSMPGELHGLGLTWPSPAELLRVVSPPVLAAGLWGICGGTSSLCPRGRAFARAGALGALLLLATPLYPLVRSAAGAWVVPRFAFLAFSWIAAAGWAEAALGEKTRSFERALAAAFCFAALWLGGARVVRDYRHPQMYGPFAAAAQDEAASLEGILSGKMYLSVPPLALGIAAPTRGLPLSPPPGEASPIHPFGERARDAVEALSRNTPACWAHLAGKYPRLEYVVTPAPGAEVENRLWSASGGAPPGAVRERLLDLGAAEPVHSGAFFVVDRLSLEALRAAGGDSPCGP